MYSNADKKDVEELIQNKLNEKKQEESCPVCKARQTRERTMRIFEDEIVTFLRTNRFVKMDSCILCVQKHVARAFVYYEELITAQESGTDTGEASVSVFKNHLKILGHLGCAIEESLDFIELNTLLLSTERKYRYEGITPDWNKIMELLKKEKEKLE